MNATNWDRAIDLADATEVVVRYDVTADGRLEVEWVDARVDTFAAEEDAAVAITRRAEAWDLLSDRERDDARHRGTIERDRVAACEWLRVDPRQAVTTSAWGSAYITLRCGRVVRLSDHAPTSSSRGEHHVEIEVGSADMASRAALRAEVARQLRAAR